VSCSGGTVPATSSVLAPIEIVSPILSGVCAATRVPLTKVPLVDPRSSIVSPWADRVIMACFRDSSASPPSEPSPGTARPISSSPTSWISAPAALPAVTRRTSLIRPR
jgi:hypothetical protein